MAATKSKEIEYFANAVSNFEKILFGKTQKDRRQKVTHENTLLQCIGRIRSQWSSTSIGYGTGTAFEYDVQLRRVFVITCAHNLVREDENKLENPETVYFERRENAANGSRLVKEYECDLYEAHGKYSFKDQCPNDLAIVSFTVPEYDTFYCELLHANSDIIQVKTSNIAVNSETFQIYGFPCNKSKYSKVINGELWGMEGKSKSYDATNKVELYVRKNSGKNLYFYNSIDTEPGQSGSAIFISLVVEGINFYSIVGVHTGGSIKKNGIKNWGVAMNQSKMKWLLKCKNKITGSADDADRQSLLTEIYIQSIQAAAASAPGPAALNGASENFIHSYRFFNGDISRKEYGKKVAITTSGSAGGILGSVGGASLGATIGTMILPGVGTTVGSVIGAMLFGVAGTKSGRLAADSLFNEVIEEDDL